jgi:hypothetical protein
MPEHIPAGGTPELGSEVDAKKASKKAGIAPDVWVYATLIGGWWWEYVRQRGLLNSMETPGPRVNHPAIDLALDDIDREPAAGRLLVLDLRGGHTKTCLRKPLNCTDAESD